MPPKKAAKIQLTQEARDRQTFNRQRGGQHVILVEHVEPVFSNSVSEAEKMNAAFDSLDNLSLELFNYDGVRVKFEGNKQVIHENQPPEHWRPSQHVELIGNFPQQNRPHKKMQLIDPDKRAQKLKEREKENKKKQKKAVLPPEIRNGTIRDKLLYSIRQLERCEEQCQSPKSFRVFAAPKPHNDRLPGYSYTPIRNKKTNYCSTPGPGSFKSPQMASTPLTQSKQFRKTECHAVPVFDISSCLAEEKDLKKSVEVHTAIAVAERSETLKTDATMSQNVTEKTFRKAETSMSEILIEEAAVSMEENNYTMKRQRTASPDTMCQRQGTSVLKLEPDARRTLQPQRGQMLRESRLSVMTTASSRRQSIDSLLDDMTLDVFEDQEVSTAQNTLLETRNIPTGMTIMNDDASVAVFYLAEADFSIDSNPSILSQLLHIAGQKEVETWKDVPKGTFTAKNVKKLGEGSYGEVYSTVWDELPVAIKVVAFELDEENRQFHGDYNGDKMPLADVVLPEVVVMKELSSLRDMDNLDATPNFINMISAKIVKGTYPAGLKTAWNSYQKESENTAPTKYATKNQHFMLFVTENGGIALEDFVLQSEQELRSILVQLILSMQVAENSLEFEHRDLHLGNVLIDRCGVKQLEYKVHGHAVPLNANGVKANIIDFTLSRIKKEGTYVFYDLDNDPFIFEGQGNAQFDVYRRMRNEKIGSWKDFHIRTNLMWIEYLAKAMLDSETICPPGLLSEERIAELRGQFDRLGQFKSCKESLIDLEFFDVFYKGIL